MLRKRTAGLATLLTVTLLGGCAGTFGFLRSSPPPQPKVDPAVVEAQSLTRHLQLLERYIEATPAQQARILASARVRYHLKPTAPRAELDYALLLATPGDDPADPTQARALLNNVLASQSALLPAERALALMVLHDVDRRLELAATTQQLKVQFTLKQRLKAEAAKRRLDEQLDENARLRHALARARAKLKAIANIERSLNPSKSTPRKKRQ